MASDGIIEVAALGRPAFPGMASDPIEVAAPGRPAFPGMTSDPIEVAALGRSLFPGMLYDCRSDSFIPGVTLWDEKSLREDLDTRPKPQTYLKFSSSDSLSSKSSLMDISASLKASFLGGLVEVEGSAKYLHDSKSSNQQSRVTMYYSETSRFEQLTMTQLGQITYPQVFDQKTATHVVTAVLYGAQTFMVFDRTFSEEENKQEIQGELNVMVHDIPTFSIDGEGAAQMTDGQKEMAEKITCTFYGDVRLEQNPTTYIEALDLYKQLPTLLKENAVPIKVWLYPLHVLDNKAAQLEREISTSLVSNIQDIMEGLEKTERTYNDLCRNRLVNVFSDIKERLHSFQESFNIYKTMLRKAVARVLPAIRGGGMEEKSLEDILKFHYDSPFIVSKLNQWLDDAKSELCLLSSYIKTLGGIKTEDSDSLNTILLDPDIAFVVCLTITSLRYEDPYLSTLKEFLNSDQFKKLDGNQTFFSWASVRKWFIYGTTTLFPVTSVRKWFIYGTTTLFPVTSVRKWFDDPDVIIKMRENLSHFRSFSEANKDDNSICFIISAISDPSNKGSSIYLYEQGKLTDTQFQPVTKPPPPIVKDAQDKTVTLNLQKSPTGETVQYRVEYRQVKADSGAEEQWRGIDTADEDFTLTGLESGKPYLIRYRIVSKVGVSEASDTVSHIPSSGLAQPVMVGGEGSAEFTFITPSSSTFKKISITYTDLKIPVYKDPTVIVLNTIQVTFNTGHVIKIGNFEGWHKEEFLFDENDKIVSAKLWPNKDLNKLGGLEFVVTKSDGTKRTFSLKCYLLGEPVSVDVKSGKCYGITARSGDEIEALGFFFI